MKVTGITLKRSGIWTEVWATVDGRETFLIREVYENEFHHSITSAGIVGCRYDSRNSLVRPQSSSNSQDEMDMPQMSREGV